MKVEWEIKNGPVAILGEGISGRAASRLLSKMGIPFRTFDQNQSEFTLDAAKQCSLVVCSPGFHPEHPWLERGRIAGKRIIGEVDLGALFSEHDHLVAITGTNGKTSLTTILHHLAVESGIHSLALGNLGRPISEAVFENETPGSTVFLEMSSFQTAFMRHLKPDAVLWTNFADDHLDFHGTEREYFQSKLKLVHSCTDSSKVWIGVSVVEAAKRLRFELPVETKIVEPLGEQSLPAYLPEFLKKHPQLENLAFALAWFEESGLAAEQAFEILKSYSPQPHRLSKVAECDQAVFWNDSKSTNLASVVSACKSFSQKLFWIGGGRSKGQNESEFASCLEPFVEKAFLIGESGPNLIDSFRKRGVKAILCNSLKDAVRKAFLECKHRNEVLFSPGFSSFDAYRNYEERGISFQRIVLDLMRTTQQSTNASIQKF